MMPTLLHRRRSTYVVAVGLLLVAAVVLLRGVVTTTVVVRPGGGPEEDHAAGSLPAVQQDLMASFTAGNNPCLVPAPSTPFPGIVGKNGHHGIIADCQTGTHCRVLSTGRRSLLLLVKPLLLPCRRAGTFLPVFPAG